MLPFSLNSARVEYISDKDSEIRIPPNCFIANATNAIDIIDTVTLSKRFFTFKLEIVNLLYDILYFENK